MTTEHLNAPVCRHCGSDDFASIERTISWRRVAYAPDPDHGWTADDDSWGDDIGDAEGETVGIACQNCYTEVHAPNYDPALPWNARELVTTAGVFARLPVRTYRVTLVYADPNKPSVPGIVDPWTEHPRPILARAKTEYLAGRAAVQKMNKRNTAPGRIAPARYHYARKIEPAA